MYCAKTANEMPFGGDFCGHMEPCIRWGHVSPQEEAVLELVQPIEVA